MNVAQLADILKRRNVRKVRYFHTDHFEPWSKGVNANTAKGVELFAKQSRQSRFAESLSLFYHTFLPFQLDPQVVSGSNKGLDAVLFGNRSEEQHRLAREAMLPLEGEGRHEIHLHIHHESWTRNTEEYSKDVSRWVNTHSDASMDYARLERAIVKTKEYITHDIGRPVEKWAFIHGNWALNASDRTICWIENEIELLMKHGCFGDFTFPAGRGYCDPVTVTEPYTCLPVAMPKGYDTPGASPIAIGRGVKAFGKERFFIWNSPIKADYSSLDYYSESNRERFKDAAQFVKMWLEKSVVIDDVLYIKTHAHSMKWEYEIDKGQNPIPHLHPDIKEIFGLLERVCEAATLEVEVMTVNSLMWELEKLTLSTKNVESEKKTSPIDSAISALGDAMSAWLDGSADRDYAAGDFYRFRISGKRWIEDYERAVIEHILRYYDRESTVITEVGCGLGTLTFVLAALGYRTKAIEGDKRRSDGALWLKSHGQAKYPRMVDNYIIVEGFFPDVLAAGFIEEGKTNILVSTNLIHTFSAQNQERILRSARLFDKAILDSSRFGISRQGNGFSSQVENCVLRYFSKTRTVFASSSTSLIEYEPYNSIRAGLRISDSPLLNFKEVIDLGQHVCSAWLAELNANGVRDNFIESKLVKHLIDGREANICQQLKRIFDPAKTRIIEVGSACGVLALLLANQGFEVIGFEGGARRAKAAETLKKQWLEWYPDRPIMLEFIPQLFPRAYDAKLALTGKRTVLLATNIVSTYSGENQHRILAAAASFTDVVIDIGRFGVNRDSQEDRTALLHSMSASHFLASSPLFYDSPNEVWHFVVPPIIVSGNSA